MSTMNMKTLWILTALSLCVFPMMAQDAELNSLADIVKSLKAGGEKAYNTAVAKLASDRNWTPMDELQADRSAECKASDHVPGFKLNSIMTNAENKERYQTTTGNHINGADSRYCYSLFEKTLRPGKSVEFTLPERWGEQTILIIPYQGANARISASASSGGKEFEVSSMGDGILRLTGTAAKGTTLTLKVTNGSEGNVSYVILNHNSRK